jgi:ribosomal protein S18 acetylase RimI-like enzyme
MISVELIEPSSSNWELLGKEVFKIERKIFADKAFSEEMMRSDLDNPTTRLVLLKDNGSVIGFTYALPEGEKIAGIVDVAIKKEYQHQGLVGKLMSCLEAKLKQEGYEYIITHAMVENGYADKIVKSYGSRIVETKEFVGEYGKQRYFKIHL